jgi:integrase/recombinase XerC
MNRQLRARALLTEMEALGLGLDDLLALAHNGSPSTRPKAPAVADYMPVVAASYGPGTAATYGTHWRLLVEEVGCRPVDTICYDDCVAIVDTAGRRAVLNGGAGRSSRETCIAALRAFFERARRAGLISTNPAAQLTKPRRLASRRRGLTDDELSEVWQAVALVTKDPDLDLLLVRFHLQSGARRIGALQLRVGDLDTHRATVWLREKFDDRREQPLPPSTVGALLEFAHQRGSTQACDPVFRTKRSAGGQRYPAMSRRHYNSLFERVQAQLTWSQHAPVTPHVLRHTAITAVERHAGFAVAQRFAGHAGSSVTSTYVKADLGEVATAVAALSGEPHPLSREGR